MSCLGVVCRVGSIILLEEHTVLVWMSCFCSSGRGPECRALSLAGGGAGQENCLLPEIYSTRWSGRARSAEGEEGKSVIDAH